jgi:hypothetical protein
MNPAKYHKVAINTSASQSTEMLPFEDVLYVLSSSIMLSFQIDFVGPHLGT